MVRARKYAGVQTLRGVAAVMVVLGHIATVWPGMGLSEEAAYTALGFLRSGVDVFFVISGFIIALTATETSRRRGRSGVMEFLTKRALRIYPIYWIVFLAVAISGAMFQEGPRSLPRSFAMDLSFVQEILLLTRNNRFVPQAWSLTFEIAFYASVAVVMLIDSKRIVPILLGVIGGLAILACLPVPQVLGLFSEFTILEFGFGVAVAAIIRRGITALWFPALLGSITLFAAAFAMTKGVDWVVGVPRILIFGVGSALAVYGVTAAELRERLTFPRWMQYLGEMSYSLYVWHLLILVWLAMTIDYFPWIPGPLQMAIWLIVVLLASAITYQFIELPLLKISHRRPQRAPAITAKSSPS